MQWLARFRVLGADVVGVRRACVGDQQQAQTVKAGYCMCMQLLVAPHDLA